MVPIPCYSGQHYTQRGRLRIHSPPEVDPTSEEPKHRKHRYQISSSDRLKTLVGRAQLLNGLINTRSVESLNLSLELGRTLTEAKATVRVANKKGFGERGGWKLYVTETIDMSDRTASYYMKGAKGFDKVPQEVKTAIIADLPPLCDGKLARPDIGSTNIQRRHMTKGQRAMAGLAHSDDSERRGDTPTRAWIFVATPV